MLKLISYCSSFLVIFLVACQVDRSSESYDLQAILDEDRETISVFRMGQSDPILVQNAQSEFRPYLHPITAPDGNGLVTEFSPGHHGHQTGIYWGFTRVNGEPINQDSLHQWFYKSEKTPEQMRIKGRDYFHNPGEDYFRRVDFSIIDPNGESVRWQTKYHLLDENSNPILEETQTWSLEEINGIFYLDLIWQGLALEDITVNEFDYGGLFLRMPWKEGMDARAVNFARQINERAEGQRALWVDVGMQTEGRHDYAHIAIFDHPDNNGFPQTWRVDNQMGVGPVRARMGDWKIAKGETETIKHQLIVYTGELNDLDLTEKWKTYIGDDNLYATAGLWNIARQEGRNAKFLTAEEAVKEMTVQPGYKVNAWASEPMVTQPMAFCWDDKGRLWFAENRDYETRSTGFSGSGDSRIIILEDTDRDGKADKRIVFAEGIPFPSALAVGFDGVYVGAPPNLLFIPDRDHDDKADMKDIEVLLTGWGIRDRHETINSFHWGPDGWLYGLEGFATPSKIRKPVGKGKLYQHDEAFPEDLLEAEGVDINGGVWRFHPTKKEFEVVAHGFSNPWGIDYDAKGQLFISACVIPHMFHVIPGGIYHRQGGQHFNNYVFDDIKTIVDHRHRSAHGGARIYQSDAFPEDQRGRLFMANIHEHAVLSDILEGKGSGFVAHHGEDFLLANNAQWIGFSMEVGPDGGLYVLDWHDADICGEDVLHKETGRVFRIMPEVSKAEQWQGRYDDLSRLSDLELARMQTSQSSWHARRARVILQYRATKGGVEENAIGVLFDLFKNHQQVDIRLQGMWALHITNELEVTDILDALNDEDEYIRAWAIQLLTEDKNPSRSAIKAFVRLANEDLSPVVRLYLAAALQRMEPADKWSVGQALAMRNEDIEDHNIPKMLWFGMESVVASDIDLGIDLALKTKIPGFAKNIARRTVDLDDGLEKLVTVLADNSTNQLSMLKGLQAGIGGRTDLKAPLSWETTYASLKGNDATATIAQEIAQQFGDLEAANQMYLTLQNSEATVSERRSALLGLASRRWPELSSSLPVLINDPDLSIEAIRAISHYNDRELGMVLLKNYNDFNKNQKSETIMSLASRRQYGEILVEAIKSGEIPKSDIPVYVARQLRRVMGNGFVEVWGPIDEISDDVSGQYEKYQSLLSEEVLNQADVQNGKVVFSQTCGPCHQMFGEGGLIGPELTGSNRTNLGYLLTNMIEPNAVIQDDYKMTVVTTRDGRTYIGNISSESDKQLTMRIVGQDQVTINLADVQSREQTPNSMMPPGLLSTLAEDEVVDLVAYLSTGSEL